MDTDNETPVFTPFHTNADDYLLQNKIYCAQTLPCKNLAIGTLQGGIVILSQNGEIENIIDKSAGLPSNGIYSLFVDSQSNLWAGMEKGIAKIDVMSPLTILDKKNDIDGNILSCFESSDFFYVGTFSGLFGINKKTLKVGSPIVLNEISSDDIFTMDFTRVKPKNSEEEMLLFSSIDQVSLLEKDKITERICKTYPGFSLERDKQDSSIVYIGFIGFAKIQSIFKNKPIFTVTPASPRFE
ncbi:MAG: hypothetical protein C0594_01535, partial [Marinilabiliales bacterium]